MHDGETALLSQQIEDYLRREITDRLDNFFRNALEIQDRYERLKQLTELEKKNGSLVSEERKKLLRFCEFLFNGEP